MARLEHIGVAVQDPDAVARLYHRLLDILPYKHETVRSDGVRTHFLPVGSTKLELLESIADDSPVARFLERRGEGVHHLAFEVGDLEAAITRLRGAGFTLLNTEPRTGADDKRIVFLHPKDTHGVLVEFCESLPVTLDPVTVPSPFGPVAAYERGRTDAPPVLLLHGAAGCTELETAPLLRRLEPHFRVLALDFSGHGHSAFPASDATDTDPDLADMDAAPDPDSGASPPDAPSGDADRPPRNGRAPIPPFTPDLFVENARAVLDHFDVDAAHVFGFSMGGTMAIELAARHPDRVRRLAVHSTAVDWDADRVEAMQARLDAEAVNARRPELAVHLDTMHRDWARLFQQTAVFVETLPDRAPALAAAAESVEAPTLVSAVDEDDLFPLDAALHLHRLIPDARLAVLPGTRHALSLGPLDLLTRTLHRFFTPDA